MRLTRLVRDKLLRLPEASRVLLGNASLLFAASRLGDILNLFTATYLVPMALSQGDLGAVEPVTRLAALGATPMAVVSAVAVKYLSDYHAMGAYGRIRRFMRDMAIVGLVSSVLFIGFLLVSFKWFGERMGIGAPSDVPFLLPALCCLAALSCCQPIAGVVLQGLQRFRFNAISSVAEPAMRILFVILLIHRFKLTGYIMAVFLAGVGSVAIAACGLRDFMGKGRVQSESYYDDLQGMWSYAWPVATMIVATTAQGFIVPFVVKHFLSTADADGFYMVSRFGYIPSYLIGSVAFVLFPIISYRKRRGETTADYLGHALLMAALVSAIPTVALGFGASWIFGLCAKWQTFQAYAPYVWRMGLIATLTAIAGVYATHEIAARRFAFLWILVPITTIEVVVLYCTLGFSAFRDILPATTWEHMSTFFPRSLGYVIGVMLVSRLATAIGLALAWRVETRRNAITAITQPT